MAQPGTGRDARVRAGAGGRDSEHAAPELQLEVVLCTRAASRVTPAWRDRHMTCVASRKGLEASWPRVTLSREGGSAHGFGMACGVEPTISDGFTVARSTFAARPQQ